VQNSWFDRTALLEGAAQKSSAREWELFDQISSFEKSCSKTFTSGKRAVQNDQLLTASVFNSSSVQN
jgi:hypothetical protein